MADYVNTRSSLKHDYSCFALQAIVLSLLLVGKKPRKQSNVFLSLIVFFFALIALNIAWINILLGWDLFHVFRCTQLELMFGIGPALYFNTKSITDPTFRFSKRDYLHFLLLVLAFFFYRTAYYRLLRMACTNRHSTLVRLFI